MAEIDKACEVIEQLLEPCEKCGKQAGGARWGVGETEFVICEDCYSDNAGFVNWLAGEIETAVAESGEWEKLPDGKWRPLENV